MKRVALPAAALAVAVALVALRNADAQRVDPRRAATFVVGTPGGAAPMQRVDGRRSGAATSALPSPPLRVAWRKTIGMSIDQPALAAADGTVAVVTTRGDVVFLDGDGEEQAHVTVGAGSVGPAAITSDGTVVFGTVAGDVIGVKRSSLRPRFTTRIGGERSPRAAPLALDDGGVVLSAALDLVVIDAEGNVRARVTLPEAPAAPLVASGDKVVAVSITGTVYGWVPGREPVRLGSFGAPLDGGAALTGTGTLIGVIEGNHLVELDLARGARATRAVAPQGLYLGPPAVQGLARGAPVTALAYTADRSFVVRIDAGGQETLRAPVSSHTPASLPDGGAAPLTAPPHVGPLVDPRGGVAFAAPDGHVGVVTPEGAVERLGELVCSKSGRSAGIAGLTPLGRASFAVTCEGGAIVRVAGPEPELRRRDAAPGR